MRVIDLLHGLMLPSGNDAAMALARFCGDKIGENGIGSFVERMNHNAQKCGLHDTHYNNPHGLIDVRNKSTARDVSKLAAELLKDSFLRSIVGCKTYTAVITNKGETRKQKYLNTNKMLDYGFIGVKTGITNNAGPCLCSAMDRKGRVVIVTLVNSRSMDHRWHETAKLVDWAYSRPSPAN
jgi:D-alanyl-D-alanine carboxypeptidase